MVDLKSTALFRSYRLPGGSGSLPMVFWTAVTVGLTFAGTAHAQERCLDDPDGRPAGVQVAAILARARERLGHKDPVRHLVVQLDRERVTSGFRNAQVELAIVPPSQLLVTETMEMPSGAKFTYEVGLDGDRLLAGGMTPDPSGWREEARANAKLNHRRELARLMLILFLTPPDGLTAREVALAADEHGRRAVAIKLAGDDGMTMDALFDVETCRPILTRYTAMLGGGPGGAGGAGSVRREVLVSPSGMVETPRLAGEVQVREMWAPITVEREAQIAEGAHMSVGRPDVNERDLGRS